MCRRSRQIKRRSGFIAGKMPWDYTWYHYGRSEVTKSRRAMAISLSISVDPVISPDDDTQRDMADVVLSSVAIGTAHEVKPQIRRWFDRWHVDTWGETRPNRNDYAIEADVGNRFDMMQMRSSLYEERSSVLKKSPDQETIRVHLWKDVMWL